MFVIQVLNILLPYISITDVKDLYDSIDDFRDYINYYYSEQYNMPFLKYFYMVTCRLCHFHKKDHNSPFCKICIYGTKCHDCTLYRRPNSLKKKMNKYVCKKKCRFICCICQKNIKNKQGGKTHDNCVLCLVCSDTLQENITYL